jgi:hypothetical protein
MSQMRGGYHVISNVLDAHVALPIDITPTLRIAKADGAQIEVIQRLLTQISGGFPNSRIYYENHWVETKESDTSSRSTPHPLRREDWRYYVVSYSGSETEAYKFLRAANLTCPALSSFAEVHTEGEYGTGQALGWGIDQVVGTLAHLTPHSHRAEVLDAAAADELRGSYERFTALDSKKHSGIAHAIELLSGLRRIPHGSDLLVLGLFAVIEMLLTHKPNDKEIGDSLLHQISTKIPLLSARLSSPLDYGGFERATEVKVWKRLYEYRSTVAHGGTPDFNGSLSLLRNRDVAVAFLEGATRRLLRHALNEPVLVDALKPI